MSKKSEEKKSTTDIVTSSNSIAMETTIIGDIVTEGNIRIEGKVQGGIRSANKIVVGESAYVSGDIHAREAEISGRIDGGVNCSGTLYLKKNSYINGDIYAVKLIIENGAIFNGKCDMTGGMEIKEGGLDEERGRRTASR